MEAGVNHEEGRRVVLRYSTDNFVLRCSRLYSYIYSKCTTPEILTHISYCAGEQVYNLRVLHSHCAGAVNLNDTMSYSHPTPLTYGATHERTDLTESKKTQNQHQQ